MCFVQTVVFIRFDRTALETMHYTKLNEREGSEYFNLQAARSPSAIFTFPFLYVIGTIFASFLLNSQREFCRLCSSERVYSLTVFRF